MASASKRARSNFAFLAEFLEEKRKAGFCIDCENPRGEDGTTTRCRSCANRVNRYSKKKSANKKPPPQA